MRDNNKGNKIIAKNAGYVYARLIITTVLNLLATKYALLALGQSDFGLFNVVGGVVTILNVFSTAMSTTSRRYINVEMGLEDGNVNKVFNVCFEINKKLAFLVFILAESIGMVYIYFFLNVDQSKFFDSIIVFQLSTIVAALGVINVAYQSVIAAYERFSVVAFIDVLTNVLKLVLILLLFLFEDNRLICYAIIMCLITIVSFSLYSGYCKRKWPEVVARRKVIDKKLFKSIMSFNNYTALGASSYIARAQGSNMIINYFFGTLVNGAFSIAYMVENYMMMFVSNLTVSSAPQISINYSAGNFDRSIYLTQKINRFSILFMLAMVFLLLLELDFVLGLWLGIVPEGAIILCTWTLISAFTRSLGEGIPTLIQTIGKIKWFQIIGCVLELLALPVSIVLFYYESPAQAIIICYIVASLIYRIVCFVLLYRMTKFDILHFVKDSYLPVLKVLMVLLPYFFLYRLYIKNILESGLLGLTISFIVVAFSMLYLGLTAGEREFVINWVIKSLNKRSNL